MILLCSVDKDSKDISLFNKGKDVLEVGRVTNSDDHFLVILKEFVVATQTH